MREIFWFQISSINKCINGSRFSPVYYISAASADLLVMLAAGDKQLAYTIYSHNTIIFSASESLYQVIKTANKI